MHDYQSKNGIKWQKVKIINWGSNQNIILQFCKQGYFSLSSFTYTSRHLLIHLDIYLYISTFTYIYRQENASIKLLIYISKGYIEISMQISKGMQEPKGESPEFPAKKR